MYDNHDDDNNNERSAGDVIFGFKRKWDNYWYHYKFHTFIGIAMLIFLTVCITQCVSQCEKKTQSDGNIAYIGSKEIEGSIFLTVMEDFESILNEENAEEGTEDIKEDAKDEDKLTVYLSAFLYMTSGEIENARTKGNVVDTQALMNIKKQIDLEIWGGSSVIYFLSPGAYKDYSKIDGMFMPIEDALGYLPEAAADNYSIKLSELLCWEYFEGMYEFPQDTVIAVRNYQTTSKKGSEKETERYNRNFEILKKIVEFLPPIDDTEEPEAE